MVQVFETPNRLKNPSKKKLLIRYIISFSENGSIYAPESLFRHRYGDVVDPYHNPRQQYGHRRQLDVGRGPSRGHAHRSCSTQGGSRFYGQLREISDQTDFTCSYKTVGYFFLLKTLN